MWLRAGEPARRRVCRRPLPQRRTGKKTPTGTRYLPVSNSVKGRETIHFGTHTQIRGRGLPLGPTEDERPGDLTHILLVHGADPAAERRKVVKRGASPRGHSRPSGLRGRRGPCSAASGTSKTRPPVGRTAHTSGSGKDASGDHAGGARTEKPRRETRHVPDMNINMIITLATVHN